MIDSLAWTAITVVVFLAARWANAKSGLVLLNPLLICLLVLSALLACFGVDYQSYSESTLPISGLLECAVVLLGYPFFRQLKTIIREWHLMLAVGLFSSVAVICLCVVGGSALGISESTIKSMVMMCTTTPIAMETAELLGGSPSLAAIMVLLAGLTGSVLASLCFDWLRVKDERARGLAMGAVSHALGTATIAQTSIKSAAYSSTALIMCAIISAVLAPALVPVLLQLF